MEILLVDQMTRIKILYDKQTIQTVFISSDQHAQREKMEEEFGEVCRFRQYIHIHRFFRVTIELCPLLHGVIVSPKQYLNIRLYHSVVFFG